LAGKNYALVLFQSFSICFAQRHEGHKDLCFLYFVSFVPLCDKNTKQVIFNRQYSKAFAGKYHTIFRHSGARRNPEKQSASRSSRTSFPKQHRLSTP